MASVVEPLLTIRAPKQTKPLNFVLGVIDIFAIYEN